MNVNLQEKNETKWALVVEGGAMRGIFSTGILDAFIKEEYNPFEWCIGVSAGATNIAAYLAHMFGRNRQVYMEYSTKPEFINFRKFFSGHHLMDLDWLWKKTIDEVRLDLGRIMESPSKFYVGVTNVETGKVEFIKPTEETLEEAIKASSAVPVIYKHPVNVDGTDYIDGGVADPIPVKKAIQLGATHIVVLRSKKYNYRMDDSNKFLTKFMLRKLPKVQEALSERSKIYNAQLEYIRSEHEGVRMIEVCPPDTFQTKRLTKDLNILERDYKLGYEYGEKLIQFLKAEPQNGVNQEMENYCAI
jgi:predicted patatin/cPLA2 family phospholipase